MSFKKPLILLMSGLGLLAGCTTSAPVAVLAPVSSPAPVTTVWNKHINAPAKVDLTKFTPAVDGAELFTSDIKGHVSSVQLSSGTQNWQVQLKQPASAGVAVGGGRVFVPTVKGQLYALNEQTGKILWQVSLPDVTSTGPTYAKGQVYIKTLDDKMVALNAATGASLWTYDEGATQLQLLGSSRAVVSGNSVVAGFSDGKLAAVNASNGQLIWQAVIARPQGFSDMAQMVGIFADPVIAHGTIFVATYNGTLAAVDLGSGNVLWQRNFSNYAGIAAAGNSLFAANPAGTVYAINQTDGTVLWKQNALHGRQLSGLATDSNNIVVGDNQGNLHWLSQQDGHFTARTFLGKSPISVTPLVISGNVVALTLNGNIFVLRLVA